MRLIFARMVGKRWVAWVILALGLTFSVLALFLLKARIESEARLRFDNNVMSVSYAIQSRIWSYYDVLYGVQGLFKVSDAVTRADFRRYASSLNLRERYPGFQVLSFSRYLQRTEIKDYEERVRRDTSIVLQAILISKSSLPATAPNITSLTILSRWQATTTRSGSICTPSRSASLRWNVRATRVRSLLPGV